MTLDMRPSNLDLRPSTCDPRLATLDLRPSTSDPRLLSLAPRLLTLDPRPLTLDPRQLPTLNTKYHSFLADRISLAPARVPHKYGHARWLAVAVHTFPLFLSYKPRDYILSEADLSTSIRKLSTKKLYLTYMK